MKQTIEAKIISKIRSINIEKNLKKKDELDFEYNLYKIIVKNIHDLKFEHFTKNINESWKKIVQKLFRIRISNSPSEFHRNYRPLKWLKYQIKDIVELFNLTNGIEGLTFDFNRLLSEIKKIRNVNRTKLILLGVLNSEKNTHLSNKFKTELDRFLHLATSGECNYILNQILQFHIDEFPILKKHSVSKLFEEKIQEKEEIFDYGIDDIVDKLSKAEIKELYQNHIKLNDELDKALALTDIYLLQKRDKVEQMHKIIEEYQKDAKIDVFTDLNSVSCNFLLDNVYIGNQIYLDLQEQGWKPNHPNLIDILQFFSFFNQFLRKNNIVPINQIGDILEITLKNIKNYDFIGSEFKDRNEIKNVRVKTPGWKYNDKIISKPNVIEIN